jgi:hypothetical protein
VKIVEEDYADIDTSNIVPRAKRRAALATGLVSKESKPKPKASTTTSSSSGGGGLLKKPKKQDDDDDEAEFD